MQEMPKSTRSVIKISPRKAIAYIAVVIAVVLIDQFSKWVVVRTMTLGESIPVIKDFFHFTYILNKGAAFGMLADNRWVFLVLSTVAILAIAVGVILLSGKIRWGYGICFSMIVGGGVGNMVDRIFNGEVLGSGAVIDFIDFRGIWSYIFNIADSFVCVGAGILILLVIIDEVKEYRQSHPKQGAPAEKPEPSEAPDEPSAEATQDGEDS